MSSTTSATDPPRWATAFAPASVGNVAIGFGILGFSVGALGDRVTVSRTEMPAVTITDITGI
jgi:homoserine kinase